ncbi:phasin family protein [Bradyrhizobium sp. Tv2a-2]|uniref:phasin family protein n=1 Tax=Bradyrhizobium sp. Tv2a-2 TaxID=113395 RepID=UPI000465D8C1|nr:phasin family protein [Bradyrhizobium sp. Tv2a-2]
MANPREDETGAQRADEKLRRAGEKTAEQARQIGQATIDAGQDAARAGADILQQNAETLKNTWRSSLDTTTTVMGSSADQLSRTLGLSGDEAQQAAERSARNTEVILYSTAAVAKCMTEASREYLEFVRRQVENNMERMNDLWRCRTPHDFTALQTDLVRQSFEGAFQSGRRMADMSLKLADDTAKHIRENMERMRRAA